METNSTNYLKDRAKLRVVDSVPLKDGTIAKINDFVYVESPNPGDFYQIVRIMRFIPYMNKRDAKCEVQHFYRRHNTGLSWSPTLDPKKVYITLATEEININYMVSKCYVNHLHYINDKESYLRLENHFYFNQFYDRLQSKVYPTVPTETITNFPEPTLSKLKEMFSFVFSERKDVINFKEAPKYCLVCKKWCDRNKSVHCMLCEEFYHKKCCNPPIKIVMPKGFNFQCSTCLANAKVDFEDPSQVIPKINKVKSNKKSSLRSNASSKSGEIFRAIELKCTEYQQIRYIGEHADLNQLTILPVPVSSQVQLNTPTYLGLNGKSEAGDENESFKPIDLKEQCQKIEISPLNILTELPFKELILTKSKAKQKVQSEMKQLDALSVDVKVENNDPNLEDQKVLLNFSTVRQQLLSQKFMTQLRSMKFSIPTHSTQFVMHALSLLVESDYSFEDCISKLQLMSPVDFGHYSSLANTEEFENALIKHETDFEKIAQEFPPMTRNGAIHKYYEWKGKMMQKYNRSGLKQLRKHPKLVALLFPDHVDESGSIEHLTVSGSSSRQKRRQNAQVAKRCLCCHTNDSVKWFDVSEYITPKSGHSLPTYCASCHDYFLRHATPKPLSLISQSRVKGKAKAPKAKRTSRKRIKSADDSENEPLALKVVTQQQSMGTSAVSESNPSPASSETVDMSSPALSVHSVISTSHLISSGIPEQLRKLAMEDNSVEEPDTRVLKPKFRHGCMACLLPSKSSEFSTELLLTCTNCHYQVHVFCYLGLDIEKLGTPWTCKWCTNLKEKTELNIPNCRSCCQTLAFIPGSQALLPTKENGWVHLLCLVFNSSLYYDPKDDYRIGNVVREDTCTTCVMSSTPNSKFQCKSGGMTVTCRLCSTNVHPYCAFLADFKIGFIANQGNSYLNPVIICTNHNLYELGNEIFQPLSAVGFNTNQSLLSLYLRRTKQATLPQNPSQTPSTQHHFLDTEIYYTVSGRSFHFSNHPQTKLCKQCSCDVSQTLHFSQNNEYICNRCYRESLDRKLTLTPPRSPIRLFSSNDKNGYNIVEAKKVDLA